MSDENFELEVFKNLDTNTNEKSLMNSKQKESPKDKFNEITFFIIFYSKKSSEYVRTILTKKILDLKKFLNIENKYIENIKINENIFFFFYNIEKKMIRALMKKENRNEKINNLGEDELKLESSNR